MYESGRGDMKYGGRWRDGKGGTAAIYNDSLSIMCKLEGLLAK